MKTTFRVRTMHHRTFYYIFFLTFAALVHSSFGIVNLYVSPTGDDGNDGLSVGTPKQTITAAADALADLSLDKTLTDGATAITISAWVYPENKWNNMGIVSSSGSYFGLIFSGYGNGNPLEFRANNSGLRAPDYSCPAGDWYHVAGVWQSGSIHKVYIDGIEVANNSNPPGGTIDIDDWFAGSDRLIGGRYLDGSTREVHVWDRALSASEVAGLAAATPSVPTGYLMSEPDELTFNGSSDFVYLNDIGLLDGGAIVNIRAGTYRETVTVPVSGNLGAPIVFMPYNSESVIISAADPVTNWVVHSGNIWKASCNWDVGTDGAGNTLFVDGDLKFDAREGAETDPMDLSNWGHIAKYDMNSTYFVADDLTGWGDDFWNGATVRMHVNDWTLVNREVLDYDSSTGTITFDTVGVVSQKEEFGYSISGIIGALDEAEEWFKDTGKDTLYYQVSTGQDPNNLDMEFRNRTASFDVRGKDYITLKNMTFRGGSILNDSGCDNNIYSGLKMYAYDKYNYGRSYISGTNNTFRDSEVYQSWGSVATVSGEGNKLINNYFHDIGYFGTSRVLGMSGSDHLVSYNTVSNVARSFLDGYPYRSVFSYNLFEDGANLSWDTGFFDGDSGRGNGGGCIVHHNLFRNSPAHGIFMSFYAGLDLVIHHNIVHDITPFSMRFGQLQFLKYYHNTWIGPNPIGDTDASSYAFESAYNNNLQTTMDDCASLGIDFRGNANYVQTDFENFANKDFRLASDSSAIDAGIVLPGINDGYSGSAPDAGALEYGETMFTVGHDFANPPTTTETWTSLPGVNLFKNSLFSLALEGWTYTGSPLLFYGNAWNTLGKGRSRSGGNAVLFNPGEGMQQTFTGLKPDTWYTVGSETRLLDQRIECELYDSVSGSVSNASHRSEDYIIDLDVGESVAYNNIDFGSSGKYNTMELTYTRPAGTTSYSDSCSLEVHIGSASGTLLGTFEYNPVVSDSWDAVTISIADITGSQTVYLVPTGTGAAGIMLASVRLMHDNIAPDNQLTIGVRNFGGNTVLSRIGHAFWIETFEEFTFKTGPAATTVELFVQNDGLYDAYFDRLSIYEKMPSATNVASNGVPVQSSTYGGNIAEYAIDGNTNTFAVTQSLADSTWQVDLGQNKNLFGIKLTAPGATPGQLADFRVTAWSTDPDLGGTPVWQRDYQTSAALGTGNTLAIKANDRSQDGSTEIQDIFARYVKVQLLSTSNLGIAEIEVLVHDNIDMATSYGLEDSAANRRDVTFMQALDIGAIKMTNVDTADYLELSNFRVTVWDRHPDEGGSVIWQKDYPDTVGRGETLTITGDAISSDGYTRLGSLLGRTIRVQNNGGNAAGNTNLSMDNLAIYKAVDAPPATNRALDGTAEQSSNHYSTGGFAEDAINCIISPQSDFTTTKNSSEPWWQVDLGQTTKIDQLVLWNRSNAGYRIGNFRVSVYDDDPNGSGSRLWYKDYSYSDGDIPDGGSMTIQGSSTSGGTRLDAVTDARFVRVELLQTNFLHLSELQVWTAPDTIHAIPGLIEAEDYTTGGEGLAYHDTTSGNTGGEYRSDDVDIAALNDGYVVGWIDDGEWLTFTTDITPGVYNISIRVAAVTTGRTLAVQIDDATITTTSIPVTGDWNTYETVTVSNVLISASGLQQVKLAFIDGSFNVDWIEFTTSSDYDSDGIPNDWEIEYFNRATGANPTTDTDMDGPNNMDEYITGTNPQDADSFFATTIDSQTDPSTNIIVEWNTTIPERSYTVQRTLDLTTSFTNLQTGITYPQSTYTDTSGVSNAFYRVQVTLP